MAATHAVDLRTTLSATVSESSRLDGNYTANFVKSLAVALTEGTGSGQANKVYSISGTLSTSATSDIDLSGSLTDMVGNAQVFTGIKALVIVNRCTTTGVQLQVGAGSNPWISWLIATGDGIKINPSTSSAPGFFVLCSPQDSYAVTAGTADILRLTNLSGSVTLDYDIYIIGIG